MTLSLRSIRVRGEGGVYLLVCAYSVVMLTRHRGVDGLQLRGSYFSLFFLVQESLFLYMSNGMLCRHPGSIMTNTQLLLFICIPYQTVRLLRDEVVGSNGPRFGGSAADRPPTTRRRWTRHLSRYRRS